MTTKPTSREFARAGDKYFVNTLRNVSDPKIDFQRWSDPALWVARTSCHLSRQLSHIKTIRRSR